MDVRLDNERNVKVMEFTNVHERGLLIYHVFSGLSYWWDVLYHLQYNRNACLVDCRYVHTILICSYYISTMYFVRTLSCKFQLFWHFLRRRFLNDPTPLLHFCNYLPLEEDLSLYLNKPEFPLTKDNLYQV
jgi:hypothetical protein